jgi:hypothetical protein
MPDVVFLKLVAFAVYAVTNQILISNNFNIRNTALDTHQNFGAGLA